MQLQHVESYHRDVLEFDLGFEDIIPQLTQYQKPDYLSNYKPVTVSKSARLLLSIIKHQLNLNLWSDHFRQQPYVVSEGMTLVYEMGSY